MRHVGTKNEVSISYTREAMRQAIACSRTAHSYRRPWGGNSIEPRCEPGGTLTRDSIVRSLRPKCLVWREEGNRATAESCQVPVLARGQHGAEGMSSARARQHCLWGLCEFSESHAQLAWALCPRLRVLPGTSYVLTDQHGLVAVAKQEVGTGRVGLWR